MPGDHVERLHRFLSLLGKSCVFLNAWIWRTKKSTTMMPNHALSLRCTCKHNKASSVEKLPFTSLNSMLFLPFLFPISGFSCSKAESVFYFSFLEDWFFDFVCLFLLSFWFSFVLVFFRFLFLENNRSFSVSSLKILVDYSRCKPLIRSLSMHRFWTTDSNRKCALFLFNLSSHYHIFIAKSLFTCRDD